MGKGRRERKGMGKGKRGGKGVEDPGMKRKGQIESGNGK